MNYLARLKLRSHFRRTEIVKGVREALTETTSFVQVQQWPLASSQVVSQQEVPVRNVVPLLKADRIWEGPKGGSSCKPICPANLQEALMLEPTLAERHVYRQEGHGHTKYRYRRVTGQRQPGNESHNPETWDCEPVTKKFSWVPSPCCSLPSQAFPVKSFTSQHMSPQTLHFPVLDKSPLWGPGSGAPSGNKGEEIREDNVSPVFNTTSNSQGADHNHSCCRFSSQREFPHLWIEGIELDNL